MHVWQVLSPVHEPQLLKAALQPEADWHARSDEQHCEARHCVQAEVEVVVHDSPLDPDDPPMDTPPPKKPPPPLLPPLLPPSDPEPLPELEPPHAPAAHATPSNTTLTNVRFFFKCLTSSPSPWSRATGSRPVQPSRGRPLPNRALRALREG
jgi:hypothetical protein